MASLELKDDGDMLEMQLHIGFNHNNGQAAHWCWQHLNSLFEMPCWVPYNPPANGSLKAIDKKEFKSTFI